MSRNFQSILINIISKRTSCDSREIVILDCTPEDASTYSVLAHVPGYSKALFTVTVAEVLMYM